MSFLILRWTVDVAAYFDPMVEPHYARDERDWPPALVGWVGVKGQGALASCTVNLHRNSVEQAAYSESFHGSPPQLFFDEAAGFETTFRPCVS